MNQHTLEITLIASVFVLTALGLRALKRAQLSRSEKTQKALTGLLGGFILMAGTVKFFDPFTTMYTTQIALSQLPFPTLTRWLGQAVEVGAGLMLLLTLVRGASLAKLWSDGLFVLGNLMILGAMSVALYVHWHPDVPATVLPMQSKPPVMTLVVMALVAWNLSLHRRNRLRAR
ncbi:hypothetical protein [Ferrimonas balearica]|uniref:hypothetical protein n=1 Tax=Ferrimonas balearica TaxID=44012 RepID=UPI001C99F184|nr:hypothetical protein [Ferrimonas balearica]MBY5991161.1 hypothetical protein [Ferrimonas balearica]